MAVYVLFFQGLETLWSFLFHQGKGTIFWCGSCGLAFRNSIPGYLFNTPTMLKAGAVSAPEGLLPRHRWSSGLYVPNMWRVYSEVE